MRLHEYTKLMNPAKRLRFTQWQTLNNQRIYKLKTAIVKEKGNKTQQYEFEARIVNLHKEDK